MDFNLATTSSIDDEKEEEGEEEEEEEIIHNQTSQRNSDSDSESDNLLDVYKNELEDVRAGTALLDCWFIRAGFQVKWDFIQQALRRLTHQEQLAALLRALSPPTKDVIYSTTQCTNLLEDVLPFDDNRQMAPAALELAMTTDLDWLDSLSKEQAVNILIGLVELGGTQLRLRTYYACLEMWHIVQESTMPSEDFEDVPVKTGAKKKEVKRSLKTFKGQFQSTLQPETDLERDLNDKVQAFDDFMDKLKKQLKRVKGTRQKNMNEEEDLVDWIKLLPVWIVLKIFSYLDRKALTVVAKVSPYWRNAADKLLAESKVREALNTTIRQLEPERFNARACFMERVRAKTEQAIAQRFTDRRTTSRKSERRPMSASAGGSIMMDRQETSSALMILESRAEARQTLMPLMSPSICRLSAALLQAFSLRHKLVSVSVESPSDAQRISCSNNKYTITTCRNYIVPFLISTGAPQPKIENPERAAVRCITVNPVETRLVAVAYSDHSVKLWDIWTKNEIKTRILPFLVTALSSNEKYVAIGGTNIIILRWRDGKKVWYKDINTEVSCSCLHDYNLFCGTISGGIIMYSLSKDENASPLVLPGTTKVILWCHFGIVMGMSANNLILVSSGDDEYIRAWNSSFNHRVTINSRKFQEPITDLSVNLIYTFASTEDGKVYIWDAMSDTIIRCITINMDTMPVQYIASFNYDTCCKLIITSDTGIKILIFNYPSEVSQWANDSIENLITEIVAKGKLPEISRGKQSTTALDAPQKKVFSKKISNKPLTVRDLTVPHDDLKGQTFIERPNVKKKSEIFREHLNAAQSTLPPARKVMDHCSIPITVKNFAASVENWEDLSFFPRFIPLLMRQRSLASSSKMSIKKERTMKLMKDILPLCNPYKFCS